jgi:hypothetical protein
VADTICAPVVRHCQQDRQVVVAVGSDHAPLGLGQQPLVLQREGVDGADLVAGLLGADERGDPIA